MSLQPLSKVRSQAAWEFHHDSLSKRPKLAPMVIQTIATWSYTDAMLARLVSRFLKADFEIVTAMLNALSGAEGRRSAIEAAARVALSADDFALFQAVMKAVKPSRDRRNEFAHFQWGITRELPDALLLLDPKDYAIPEASFQQQMSAVGHRALPAPGPDRSNIMVYRDPDIAEEVQRALKAYDLVFHLVIFAFGGHPAADETRQWLLSQPQVRRALSPTANR